SSLFSLHIRRNPCFFFNGYGGHRDLHSFLHDALPIFASAYAESEPEQAIRLIEQIRGEPAFEQAATSIVQRVAQHDPAAAANLLDRKSTRLNSSHVKISYAVFCLKKKN